MGKRGGYILGPAGFADDEVIAQYGICCIAHSRDDTCSTS